MTAFQRLGPRVDHLDAEVRTTGLRVDGLAQRVQELAQAIEAAHTGNWEALYRLEREENLRLRQENFQLRRTPAVETTLIEGWIAQLESLAQQLRSGPPERMCLAHNLQHPVGACGEFPLTDDERRIVEKFGVELAQGMVDRCRACGRLHPFGTRCSG